VSASLLGRLANRGRDLLFVPWLDPYWRKRLHGKIMCLLYHRVGQRTEFDFLDAFGAPTITPQELAGELSFLKEQGARFMSLSELRRGEFPDALQFGVIVTFDDGFRDNYTQGLPVLERLDISGTIFQSTALVDAATLIWEHALYWYWHDSKMARTLTDLVHAMLADSRSLEGTALFDHLRTRVPAAQTSGLLEEMGTRFDTTAEFSKLARQLYPSSGELRQASESRHELASHGHSHLVRTTMDDDQFEQELSRSIEVLKRITTRAPKVFSYPFNARLPQDREACARHFEQVATVDSRPIDRGFDPLSLPRFTWPGPARNRLRRRRWLLTGRI
jgi:peptidoglycan/xylan/chitin deacetylase (PgdA/CDA1 family)